jgi:hypothetical protein
VRGDERRTTFDKANAILVNGQIFETSGIGLLAEINLPHSRKSERISYGKSELTHILVHYEK